MASCTAAEGTEQNGYVASDTDENWDSGDEELTITQRDFQAMVELKQSHDELLAAKTTLHEQNRTLQQRVVRLKEEKQRLLTETEEQITELQNALDSGEERLKTTQQELSYTRSSSNELKQQYEERIKLQAQDLDLAGNCMEELRKVLKEKDALCKHLQATVDSNSAQVTEGEQKQRTLELQLTVARAKASRREAQLQRFMHKNRRAVDESAVSQQVSAQKDLDLATTLNFDDQEKGGVRISPDVHSDKETATECVADELLEANIYLKRVNTQYRRSLNIRAFILFTVVAFVTGCILATVEE